MQTCQTCGRKTDTTNLYCTPFKDHSIDIYQKIEGGLAPMWKLEHLLCFRIAELIDLIKKDEMLFESDEQEREVLQILGLISAKSANKT